MLVSLSHAGFAESCASAAKFCTDMNPAQHATNKSMHSCVRTLSVVVLVVSVRVAHTRGNSDKIIVAAASSVVMRMRIAKNYAKYYMVS